MKTLFVTALVLTSLYGHAQLGIGTYSPHPSAQLEVNSPDKGILLPRLTEAQRLGIASPAAGLLVFQTEPPVGFYYYTGSEWTNIVDQEPSPVPAGTVTAFSGSVPPAGWAFCDGSAVSRSTNTQLFNAIGTAFGAGNGSTTFNLPDLRGRTSFGKDNMGGIAANVLTNGINGSTLAATGGSQNVTLSVSNMASHSHTFTGTAVSSSSTAHSHTYTDAYFAEIVNGGGTGNNSRFGMRQGTDNDNSFWFRTAGQGHSSSPSPIPTSLEIHSHTVTPAGTVVNKGNNTPTPVVNPSLVLNYIIKL